MIDFVFHSGSNRRQDHEEEDGQHRCLSYQAPVELAESLLQEGNIISEHVFHVVVLEAHGDQMEGHHPQSQRVDSANGDIVSHSRRERRLNYLESLLLLLVDVLHFISRRHSKFPAWSRVRFN